MEIGSNKLPGWWTFFVFCILLLMFYTETQKQPYFLKPQIYQQVKHQAKPMIANNPAEHIFYLFYKAHNW